MLDVKGLKTLLYKDCRGNLRKYRNTLRAMSGISMNPMTERWEYNPADDHLDKDFSIRQLAEGFLGQEYISELASETMADSTYELMSNRDGYVPGIHKADLNSQFAEGDAPVTASAQSNINAWDASIGGLIEVRMIQAYKEPQFIADQFMRSEPTRVNGGKHIVIPEVLPGSEIVGDGEQFPQLDQQEQWIWAQPNLVAGDVVSVTRSAIVYNLTGDILKKAESRAKGLAFCKEYYVAAHVLGLNLPLQPNTLTSFPIKKSWYDQISYKYRLNETNPSSTPNPTYQAAYAAQGTSEVPYAYTFINLITGQNGFQSWTSLQQVRQLLTLMRNPVTNLPFDSDIKKIWCHTYLFDLVQRALHASQVLNVTGNPSAPTGPIDQGAGSTVPPVWSTSAGWPQNSLLNGWSAYRSTLWDQVVLDQGVSETDAQKWWMAGDPQKAFVWKNAWDMRVDQANPMTSSLLKQNIVYQCVGQFSGQIVVEEPRFCILLTN